MPIDQGFQKIFERFSRDMQKAGIFVPDLKENLWEEPSFFYQVPVGLYRYLSSEVRRGSSVDREGNVLRDNEGNLNIERAVCTIMFQGDRSTERTKRAKKYELILPGYIDNSATSLLAMSDGVRLLTSLDYWASTHGKLIRMEKSEGSNYGILKQFVLNQNLFRKK